VSPSSSRTDSAVGADSASGLRIRLASSNRSRRKSRLASFSFCSTRSRFLAPMARFSEGSTAISRSSSLVPATRREERPRPTALFASPRTVPSSIHTSGSQGSRLGVAAWKAFDASPWPASRTRPAPLRATPPQPAFFSLAASSALRFQGGPSLTRSPWFDRGAAPRLPRPEEEGGGFGMGREG
jgi:hypothetical protein